MTRNIRLKSAIFEARLTQKAVARKAGISESWLSMAINGRLVLDESQKNRIADVLGRSKTELFEAAHVNGN